MKKIFNMLFLFFILITCFSLVTSCSKKSIIYKLDDQVILTTEETLIEDFNWIYVEKYMNILEGKRHFFEYYQDGIPIDCILNVEWIMTEHENEIIMDAEVKSILRAGIFDIYNYLEETDDIIISGIIYSENSVFKYPEYACKIVGNEVERINSFQLVDFEKLEFAEEHYVADYDVHLIRRHDAKQLAYCESTISKIIIPEQCTSNKSIPSFAFENDELLEEIVIEGNVGQINPNAFVDSAKKIIINGDIDNIEAKGFVSGSEIYINGEIKKYNNYSFYECDSVYYAADIIQVITNKDDCCEIIGLYTEFCNSYNFGDDIILKYIPYFYNNSVKEGNFSISYNIDIDDYSQSKILENVILDDQFTPYYADFEKYNSDYYHWNRLTGINIEKDILKNLCISSEELTNDQGVIYLYLRLIDEVTNEKYIIFFDIKLSIKYQKEENKIYLQYGDAYSNHYTD